MMLFTQFHEKSGRNLNYQLLNRTILFKNLITVLVFSMGLFIVIILIWDYYYTRLL